MSDVKNPLDLLHCLEFQLNGKYILIEWVNWLKNSMSTGKK